MERLMFNNFASFFRSNWFLLAISLAVITKFFVVGNTSISVRGWLIQDDQLFIDLASNIARTGWLGEYTQNTLVKGAGFPLFIAINYLFIGLPILITQQLLYCFAGLLFLIAVRPIISDRRILFILFVIYLFNPMFPVTTRIVRSGIYPSQAIIVLACCTALMARAEQKPRKLLLWSTAFGISTSWFWLTREEGLWLVPTIAVILSTYIWRVAIAKCNWGEKCFILLFPPILFLMSIGAVSGVNYAKYGVFTTSEFKRKELNDAYGALTRVKHESWKRYLPVPYEVRQKIYKASPAFSELEEYIEKRQDWKRVGCKFGKSMGLCGEIVGGWFLWALRDAASKAGYFESGGKASTFFRRLSNEVNTACEREHLDCNLKKSGHFAPIRPEHLELLPKTIWKMTNLLVGETNLNPWREKSKGVDSDIEIFEQMTHSRSIPKGESEDSKKITARGWTYYRGNPRVGIVVVDKDGKQVPFEATRVRSDGLARWKGDPTAFLSRFRINATCSNECDIVFFESDGNQWKFSSKSTVGPQIYRKGHRQIGFDTLEIKSPLKSILDELTPIDQIRTQIRSSIALLYQATLPYLMLLSVCAYIFSSIAVIRGKDFRLVILCTGLGGALAAYVLMLAIIDVVSFWVGFPVRLGVAYPIEMVFIVVALYDGFDTIKWFRSRM